MAQLTVRRIDPELVRQLKVRAARHNRSAEAEHRAILEAALRSPAGAFWREADRLREELRDRPATDSTEIIRRDRDRNWRR